MSEQDEFLKDLVPNEQTDAFNQSIEPEVETPKEEVEEAPNRRERRTQAKLQAEREANIALAAKLEVLTESRKVREEEPSEYLKKIERIYGTNSPEAKEATDLLSEALQGVEERATDRALERLREERDNERQELVKEEKTLDSMVEDIEDETGLTLDTNTQKAFFTLLERMSPKDEDGNVIAYADHHAVWESLQERREKVSSSRARDLASRSMTRTGSSPSTDVAIDSNERWLRDNGII